MQVSRMKHGQGRTEKLWLLTVFRGPFSGDDKAVGWPAAVLCVRPTETLWCGRGRV